MARRLSLELSESERKTVDLEVARLEAMHGVKITPAQFISILIEQHRLKLRLASEREDAADVLAWLWRKKDGEED